MSELDFYLLMALGCSICGLFIGMGNALTQGEHDLNHAKQRSDLARMAFALAPVVGVGYFIAWILVSHQPLLKLIPVFVLTYLAWMLGDFMTRNGVGPWWPTVGMVVIPLMFHTTRYFVLTG